MYGLNGISPQQFENTQETSQNRFTLRNAWNNNYLANKYPAACTPFRAVNNSGDLLSRPAYSCGGSCQSIQSKANVYGISNALGQASNMCDGTGIPPSTCNVKYVTDVSDYTRYLKLKAINKNYNDFSNGGNLNKPNQSIIRAIRRY